MKQRLAILLLFALGCASSGSAPPTEARTSATTLQTLTPEARLAYLREAPGEGPRHARRLLDLLADTLAGALLVEEATFDLKAGDGRKMRIAERFVRTTFGPRAAIGPDPDPDHAEIERLLGYAVIDFT